MKRHSTIQRGQSILYTVLGLTLSKRQRFIISVLLLSAGLFIAANVRITHSGIIPSVVSATTLGIATIVLLIWSTYSDLKENFSYSLFILPFFYSFSLVLFYFLFPDRLLTRLLITPFYAVGLYSLFLSQNIFIVASIRTIALLSSARTVSFILTLLSYLFLSNAIFSFHLFMFATAVIVFVYSFFLITHSLWIYTLEKRFFAHGLWVTSLSLGMFELSLILWFWPALPIFISLFFTGFFYTLVSLSHVWFERKLFRGVLWEYIWLSVIVFCVLLFFTFIAA